jgi:hypothetical protein
VAVSSALVLVFWTVLWIAILAIVFFYFNPFKNYAKRAARGRDAFDRFTQDKEEVNRLRSQLEGISAGARTLLQETYRAKHCSRCLSMEYFLWAFNENTIRIRCTSCNKMRWIKPHKADVHNRLRDDLYQSLNDFIDVQGRLAGVGVTNVLLSVRLDEPPEKTKPSGRNRRIAAETQQYVYDRDDGTCQKCGSTVDLHFDHIVPFSKGGSNEPENVQLLCSKCNLSKGAGF